MLVPGCVIKWVHVPGGSTFPLHLVLTCHGLHGVPYINAHLDLQNGSLFGNRVFEDVIKV